LLKFFRTPNPKSAKDNKTTRLANTTKQSSSRLDLHKAGPYLRRTSDEDSPRRREDSQTFFKAEEVVFVLLLS